jgi:hypothetical protein
MRDNCSELTNGVILFDENDNPVTESRVSC